MAVLWTGQTTGPAVNPVCLEGALPQRAGARVGRRTALGPGLLAAGPGAMDATPVEPPAPLKYRSSLGALSASVRPINPGGCPTRASPTSTGRGGRTAERRAPGD